MARGENLESFFGGCRSRFFCRDSVLCDLFSQVFRFYSVFYGGSRDARGALLLSCFCFVRYFSRTPGFYSAFCAGSRDARWGRFCSLAGVSRGDATEGSCHDFGVFESFAQTGKGKGSVPALPGSPCRK